MRYHFIPDTYNPTVHCASLEPACLRFVPIAENKISPVTKVLPIHEVHQNLTI